MLDFGRAVDELQSQFGISDDLLQSAIEQSILAAYRAKYREAENVTVAYDIISRELTCTARKTVVETVMDPGSEMSIAEAQGLDPDIEEGDEVEVVIDPEVFGRVGSNAARQTLIDYLRSFRKDAIYTEYAAKLEQMVTGSFQRERYGSVYVDLGNCEALLPSSERIPGESFTTGDSIKALIIDVNKDPGKHSQVILSRKHPVFVQRIFEREVPEMNDGTIEVRGIVRDAGFRTKMAVSSSIVDPVGACVGTKGVRIQTVIRELMGEKIDIVRYSMDLREYIRNALTPAEVERVLILNEEEKQALAVVDQANLAKAIGQRGRNVNLAARLVGWNIEIKTPEEAEAGKYEDVALVMGRDALGSEFHDISMLDLDDDLDAKLRSAGMNAVEDLVDIDANDLAERAQLDETQAQTIVAIIEQLVEVVDDDAGAAPTAESVFTDEPEDTEAEMDEETTIEAAETEGTEPEAELAPYEGEWYDCPVCGTKINETMSTCPGCGAELAWEEEETG